MTVLFLFLQMNLYSIYLKPTYSFIPAINVYTVKVTDKKVTET